MRTSPAASNRTQDPSRRSPRRRLVLAPLLLLGLLLGLSWAASLLSCSAPPQKAPFQNLVLILVDTLRADHVSAYGYERRTTPYLDRLAAEGLQTDGYAASSWTKASVATLLSGLHPQRHQAISRSDALTPEVPYLPDLLRQAGFRTAAYVGNRNVARRFAFDRGYDQFLQCRPTGKVDGAVVTHRALSLAEALAVPGPPATAKPAAAKPASVGTRRPFFLSVHYVDPHDPYRPAQPWGSSADEAPQPQIQPAHLRKAGLAVDAARRQQLIDQYDGEILEVDGHIERLLAGLDELGLLEGTLVVVTSDHGEEFAEHGGLTHGSTLFEEVLRVPLILWAKDFWRHAGQPAHATRHRFHQVDFLPTVLEALSLEPPLAPDPQQTAGPGALDGQSRWRQLLRPEPIPEHPYFFHLDLDRRGALALLEGDQKIILRNGEPHTLAFDLGQDPGEAHPLSSTAVTEQALERLLRHHNRQSVLAGARRIETLDDETRRSLAALGYMALDTPEEELGERVVPPKLGREGFGGKAP